MNLRHCPMLLSLSIAAAGAHAQLPGQTVHNSTPGKQGPTLVVGVGAEATDNAYKSTGTWSGCDDKHPNSGKPNCVPIEDETKEYLDLDLGYHREGGAFIADILYTGELAHYEHDTTDDDSVFNGHSMVGWRTLGNRLLLDATHDRSEQLPDSRSPDIRNNRQVRDIVSAGPTLSARLGSVDDLVFNGRWYDISYHDSDRQPVTVICPPGAPPSDPGCQFSSGGINQHPDSERLEGGVSWQHRRHKTDVMGLTYSYTDTDFDQDSSIPSAAGGDQSFEYHRLYGTYQVELRNSGYSVSLGANRSERGSGDTEDGFLAQIAWHLENGGHRFNLTGINELTDSGVGLGTNPLASGGSDYQPRDDNFGVIDVVERTSVDIGYGYDRLCGERCVLDVGLVYDNQDFKVAKRDQERAGVRASLGYRITSTLRASLNGYYSETDYEGFSVVLDPDPVNPPVIPPLVVDDRTDEQSTYGLQVDWQLSRSLRMRFWLSHEARDSDQESQSYDENYGGASIRYEIR